MATGSNWNELILVIKAESTLKADMEAAANDVKAGTDEITGTTADGSNKVKQANEESGKSVRTFGGNMLRTVGDAASLGAGLYELYDSTDNLASAQLAAERAQNKLSKAHETADKAQKEYNEAVAKYGEDSDEAKAAALNLEQAQNALSIATQQADMATGNCDDAMVSFVTGGITGVVSAISGGAGLLNDMKNLKGSAGFEGIKGGLDTLKGHFSTFASSGVGILKTGLSGIGSAFSSLGSLLAANPIIIILMAIALVAVLIITNWDAVKPFFEGLWNGLKGIFTAAWGVIDAVVIKPLMAAWGLISQAAQIMYGILKQVWDAIYSVLLMVWKWIEQNVIKPLMAGWNLISGAAETMKGILVGIWNGIYDTLLGIWGWIDKNIISPIKTAWDTIGKAAGDMKKVLEDVWNGIKSMIDTVVKEIMKIIQPFIDSAKWVIDNVGGVIDAVGGFVSDPLGSIGSFLGLAEGGVVDRPTFALLGEAGEREYVIPESKMGAVLSHGGGGGRSYTINQYVYTNDPDRAAARTVKNLRLYGVGN